MFTLAGHDVMNVSDNWVLAVTAGILSLIVGVDISLMLMGFAHVREALRETRLMIPPCNDFGTSAPFARAWIAVGFCFRLS